MTHDSPLVYVIILNWQSANETIRCVEHVERSAYGNFKVLLVDNASSDDSEATLRTRFPLYDFIQCGRNAGYAAGNNAGIRIALSKNAQYMWILNPDMTVGAESLSTMVSLMETDPSIAISGPVIRWGVEEDSPLVCGGILEASEGYRVRHRELSETIRGSLARSVEVDYMIGCDMLLRSEFIRKSGAFREEFFMYYEDVELSLRAKRNNLRTVVCGNVEDRHRWSFESKKKYFKNCIFIESRLILARIEGKYLLRSTMDSIDIKSLARVFFSGHILTAARTAFDEISSIIRALLKPLRRSGRRMVSP